MRAHIFLSTIIGASVAYYLIGAYQLLRNSRAGRLRRMLGYVFVYWAIVSAKDLVLANPPYYTKAMQDYFFFFDGITAVAYASLLLELTKPGWTSLRKTLFLLLPFTVFILIGILSPGRKALIVALYFPFLALFALSVLLVLIRRDMAYSRQTGRKNPSPWIGKRRFVRQIICFSYLGAALWVVVSVQCNAYIDGIYYIAMLILWQMTSVRVKKIATLHPAAEKHDTTKAIAQEIDTKDDIENQQEINTGVERDEDEYSFYFGDKLEMLILDEELYLDPELSINDLARRLHTNRTYLSRYFSQVLDTKFYDYINKLRIETKSIPMILEKPYLTMDSVAEESGFGSISTFRRAFSKVTGMTPGEFRKKQTY